MGRLTRQFFRDIFCSDGFFRTDLKDFCGMNDISCLFVRTFHHGISIFGIVILPDLVGIIAIILVLNIDKPLESIIRLLIGGSAYTLKPSTLLLIYVWQHGFIYALY